MSYQLATEYANMAMREPVQNAAKTALGLTELPDYEATARGIFLEIAVIHTDPRFAQAVANVIAQQLISISPVNMQPSAGTDSQFVEKQLKDLQDNIEKTRQEISTKQSSLSGLDSALTIAKTQNDLGALEEKMATLQEIYSNLFSSTREAAFNTLSVFDTAALPTTPIGPRKTLIILLAAVSGLAFAVAATYLIEFLDDTIKTTDEIDRLIDVPAIGYIGEMQGFKPTFVASHPRSPVADAFRGLRTNLEFMSVDRPMKKLSISSAEESDGKSTIAINLAIVTAQADKKVILVDADLRSPSVHRYLGISDSPGLSDVFLDRVTVKEALVEWDGTPKFLIMPAGAIPPNSAELLGSRKMELILDELAGMADIVILDGPPGFVVDAIVLSAKVDGVLLVVNIGDTRRGSIKAVVEQFKRIDANLVGTVLNRVSRGSGIYGSYYYSGYYSKEPVTRPVPSNTGSKKKFNIKFHPKETISRLFPWLSMPTVEEVKRVLKKAPEGGPATRVEENRQELVGAVAAVVITEAEAESVSVQPVAAEQLIEAVMEAEVEPKVETGEPQAEGIVESKEPEVKPESPKLAIKGRGARKPSTKKQVKEKQMESVGAVAETMQTEAEAEIVIEQPVAVEEPKAELLEAEVEPKVEMGETQAEGIEESKEPEVKPESSKPPKKGRGVRKISTKNPVEEKQMESVGAVAEFEQIKAEAVIVVEQPIAAEDVKIDEMKAEADPTVKEGEKQAEIIVKSKEPEPQAGSSAPAKMSSHVRKPRTKK